MMTMTAGQPLMAACAPRRRVERASRVFLVALQKLDRDTLWAADEADTHAGADRRRLSRELDALRLDLGGDGVDVLHRQPEMIQTLIGRHRRLVYTVAWLDLGDENVGSAQLDVDAIGSSDDRAAKDLLKP